MNGRITSGLVTLLALVFSARVLSGVGHTPGQFAVSSSGSAQYSIPIWTPPGLRGIQPNLALTYDSRLSYGLMGPGWTLGGLSAISRCNRTYAQDGTPAPIALAMADAFCFDGNRLRLTSSETLSTYGQPDTTYQTEIANFSNVTALGTAGQGPSYFTVKGKDGLTYEYGNTTDSKIIPTGSTTPYVWALDKVTDRLGNYMTFTYYQAGGAYVPLSIQYAAPNGSTTFPYKVNFVYSPKSANDTLSKYVAGIQIQQTQQLSTITVTSGGTTVREYKLLYTTSTGTLRATLTSIQECGGSAGTDCLSATSVGYQNGTAGVARPATASGSGATSGVIRTADLNGDGRLDLIFATTSGSNQVWWVQFATPTGYMAPRSIGATSPVPPTGFFGLMPSFILLDDFDAGGQTELLAPSGGVWTVYKWNGSSFSSTTTNVPFDATALSFASVDTDGDGLPEIISATVTFPAGSSQNVLTIYMRRNTTANGVISFAAPQVAFTQGPQPGLFESVIVSGNNSVLGSTVTHMDFDGDGRSDILLQDAVCSGGGCTGGAYQFLSRGSILTQVSGGAVGITTANLAIPVNWNDDACTDIAGSSRIYISGCNGSNPFQIVLSSPAGLALDWDGDGRTDILANVSGTWQLYRSEGTTIAPAVSTGIAVGTGSYVVTDKDGDGLGELAFANSASNNAIFYGLHNGAGVHPDLATSFNDGYGNTASPTYVSIVQSNYSADPYGSPVYPMKNFVVPLQVVNKVTFSDPSNEPSGTFYQTYSYIGSWIDVQGRGFRNFIITEKNDSRNGLWETMFWGNSFPWAGILNGDQLSKDQAGNSLISLWDVNNETFITLDGTAHNQRYFPYYGTANTFSYELGGTEDGTKITTATTTYTYDHYGNATTVSTVVTDNDMNSLYPSDTWTTTTVNTITPNTTTWCLNLPTETTVTNSSTAPGGTELIRTVAYNNPDYTNCRETEKVVEPGSALYKVVEDYGYDTTTGNFGNLHTVTVTGVGMTPRVTTINWTANGQFPLSIANPLSQTITLGFDANSGMKTSQTDPNYTTANPLNTTWTYDNFSRVQSESRPDGTSTTWSYNTCATNGCVNANNKMTVTETAVNIGGSTLSVNNTYLDSVDRTLVTSRTMLNGAYDRTEVQYDKLGRVSQQGAPCTFVSCTNYWTTFGYDGLNRVTQIQRPFSASNSVLQTTTINYAGRTTTVTDPPTTADPSGKVTTKMNLVTGSVARSMDQTGYYQTFKYDAFGSLLSVVDNASPANNLFSATYKYGVGAFQLTALDADLGARSYTYDALGELIAYSDAKSQNFSITYDALARPHVRTEPDLTTTWNWGNTAASFNIGKLQSVTAASTVGTYSEAYGYDSKTRLSSEQITIPGDAAYTYTLTYNATTGLLDTLQYPVSTSSYQLKLQYSYQNGILRQVSDVATGTHYWTANTMNPRGQYIQETLGNNVVLNRSLDAFTGWTNSIQAGVGSGSALQNNSYLFDVMGNLTQRQDNNLPVVTENVFPDKLYRLDHTVGDTSTQMTYDALGRIATWAAYGGTQNVKDYTTPQSGCTYYADHAQPHAVRRNTQGTNYSSYCYDANGNMSAENGFYGAPYSDSYIWTSYNQPSSISNSSNSSQFFYDASHQRYKQIASYNGSPETTYYVGGLLEKMINSSGTWYRHYIPAGSSTVVYTRLNGGANSTYYLTQNHLGSTAVITDSTGNSLVKEKFSALGWNENTTAEQGTMASVTRHEYTGHEGLDNLSTVNMNGRIYQPSGSMFLSPDPYVPDPGNTQSFNRYGYVNNNPLSLIDPTGFDDDSLDEITVTASRIWDGFDSLFSDIGSWFSSLFSGGGPKLSPLQQLAVNHGVNLSLALQGTPGAAQLSDGGFYLAADAGSSTLGPQVVGNPSPFAFDPNTIGSSPADLNGTPSVSSEPAQSTTEYLAEHAAFLQSNQALLDQSKNFSFDRPSLGTLFGQSLARSGPKALNTVLIAANFVPFLDVAADLGDAALVARGTSQASEAFSYTFSKYLASISKNGLRQGSYATRNGTLSPLQAQIELALPANRGLPDALLRIDLAGLRAAGFKIPGITRVSSRFGLPGGGYEMQFPYPVPPQFIKVVP